MPILKKKNSESDQMDEIRRHMRAAEVELGRIDQGNRG